MKVHVTADGYLDRINKALEPVDGARRVHRRHADRAGRGDAAGRRAGGDLASATRRSTTRTASRSSPTAAAAWASRRSASSSGSRSTTTATSRVPGRSRAAADPHGRHAADDRHRTGCGGGAGPAARRPPHLQRRPRGGGRRARARRGDRRHAAPAARQRRDLERRGRLGAGRRRAGRAAARRASTTPWWGSAAAARSTSPSTPPACPACRWSRWPPASPTTASPRRSPRSRTTTRAASPRYGVQMPIAVVVDLDYVRRSEPAMRRSGIGDAISNLSAIADWRLAERERGEEVDGVAVTFARVAATSIVHREDGIEDDAFLIALAEALVLSGLAMATAGLEPAVQRRRPRDPARDRPPVPGHRATTASWPARRASSRRSCAGTRAWRAGSTPACAGTACRARRPTSA